MSDKKILRKLEKSVNKDSDVQSFKAATTIDTFEAFMLEASQRDYFSNLNNTNSGGRGAESGTGAYLVKKLIKPSVESTCENLKKYISKKARQTNIAKFFMMSSVFMNIEEDAICYSSVQKSVAIACSELIATILQNSTIDFKTSNDVNSVSNYVSLNEVYKKIGEAILEEQIFNSLIIQQPDLFKSLTNRAVGSNITDKILKLSKANENIDCILKNGKNKNGDEILNVNPYDINSDLMKIGAFFVENILSSTDIFEVKNLSNVKDKSKSKIKKLHRCIALSEEMRTKLLDSEVFSSLIRPKYLPIPVKFGRPVQWNGMKGGCYNIFNVDFIKGIRKNTLDMIDETSYTQIYKAANNLQNTPFKINEKVKDTIEHLINKNVRFKNEKQKLILPYQSGFLVDELPKLPAHLEEQKEDIKSFIKKRTEWYNKNNGNKNKELPIRLNIDFQSIKFIKAFKEYKEYQVKVRFTKEFLTANDSKYTALSQSLHIAKIMGEDSFYLPSNIDWRTRYYYLPVLNPQTSDNIKGMLNLGFTERVESEDEMYFMFNCGANDYGYDKKHPDEKSNWVLSNIQQIAESGRNPIENIDFWGNADKPFMFLNFCTEIAQYLDNDMKYIDSSYICYYDGSCSGSQHFSALSGDKDTARLTNLTSDSVRHDLYAVVATTTTKLVEGIRDGIYKDEMTIKVKENGKTVEKTINYINVETKNGNKIVKIKEYFKEHSSEALDFGIDRKLVKQNVMTMTYGSTDFGRRDQIQSVYKEVVQNKGVLPFEQETIGYKSSLVSAVCYGAIAKENPGVIATMDWLESCMEFFIEAEIRDETEIDGVKTNTLISSGMPVSWHTPCGAHIVQNYKKTYSDEITFNAGTKRIRIYQQVENIEISLAKMIQGIIANMTHSLDATHMTLTINECAKHFEGFSCVHDSFGTGVKNASKLYQIIRKTFVEMYSEDVLENIYNEWFNQLAEVNQELADSLPKPPTRGTFDIKEVLNSIYSFI